MARGGEAFQWLPCPPQGTPPEVTWISRAFLSRSPMQSHQQSLSWFRRTLQKANVCDSICCVHFSQNHPKGKHGESCLGLWLLAAVVWAAYIKIAAWRGTRATVRGYRARSCVYQRVDKEYSREVLRHVEVSVYQRYKSYQQGNKTEGGRRERAIW